MDTVVSVWCPSTLYSSKTITTCIWHTNFCLVNTKTFGERSFSYAGPSVWNNLLQTLRHSDSTSSFKAALKTHLFNNYFWTVFHSPAHLLIWHCVCARACMCVVSVIVKRPVLPPSVVDGCSRNHLYYYFPYCVFLEWTPKLSQQNTNKATCACMQLPVSDWRMHHIPGQKMA